MHNLNSSELGTVLAALRFYQAAGMGEPANRSDAIHDIATSCGEAISLNAEDIDTLCERLNCASAPAGRLAIVLEGGLVQCLVSDTPEIFNSADIVVIDYDTEGADDSEITSVKQGDGSTADAICRFEGIDKAKIDLAGLVRELEA